jgi:ribosomal protein L20A (L18A)
VVQYIEAVAEANAQNEEEKKQSVYIQALLVKQEQKECERNAKEARAASERDAMEKVMREML